jgi:hypothetical protein
MSRNVVYIGLAVILVAVIAAVYLYNLGHKSLENALPDYVVTATNLFAEYSADETAANKKYLDKILEVNGILLSTEMNIDSTYNVKLDSGDPIGAVICNLDASESPDVKSLEEGQNITIRGICSGMLLDVLLNKCVIVE